MRFLFKFFAIYLRCIYNILTKSCFYIKHATKITIEHGSVRQLKNSQKRGRKYSPKPKQLVAQLYRTQYILLFYFRLLVKLKNNIKSLFSTYFCDLKFCLALGAEGPQIGCKN